jgi:hypothetical protein
MSYNERTDLEIETMCSVDGCDKPAKPRRNGYCEMHYMRVYRHGTTEKTVVASPREHSGGYRMVPANGHWLARGDSHVYEHRLVFHQTHGDGPFRCKWCDVEVTWDDMHVDHLDDDKQNNAVDNLAASCPACNQQRGLHKAAATWRSKTGIAAMGTVKTMSEWSRATGLSRSAIAARLKAGMTMDEAVSLPRGKFGPKPNGKSNWDQTDWRQEPDQEDLEPEQKAHLRAIA